MPRIIGEHQKMPMTLHKILWILIALSLSLTFFGKAVIGIGLAICVLISLILMVLDYKEIFEWIKIRSFFVSKEIIFITITFGLWLYSASRGIDPDGSLKECIEYIGIVIGGVLIFIGLQAQAIPLRSLFKVTAISAAICAVLLFFSPFMGDYRMEWSSSYASVLAVLFPFAFIRAIEGKRKPLWWMICFLIVTGIFASGGRTAWIAFTITLILIPFLISWEGTKRKIFKNYMILTLVSIIGMGLGLFTCQKIIGDTQFEIRTQSMITMDRPASGRLEVWANTLDHIEENFWWGTGIKTSQQLGIEKSENYPVLHVHNAILEVLLETGIFGLLALSLTIMVFVTRFIMAYLCSIDYRLKRQAMAVFLACIAYGVCSMALTSIFHAWWFLYLVVLIILLKTTERRLMSTQPKS